MRIALLLQLISCCLLFECESSNKQEREVIQTNVLKYPNGNTKAIIESLGSKEHGVSKWFFEDGQIEVIANYHHGLRHGTQISYHRNRYVSAVTPFHYGMIKGLERLYFEEDSAVVRDEVLYMIIEGKSVPIHKISYNLKGEVVDETSRLDLQMPDTVGLNQEYDVNIKMIHAPYENMLAFIADYDSLFNEYKEGSERRFTKYGDEKITITLKADKAGKQYLRGYISNFSIKDVNDTLAKTVEEAIYFEHSYFVKH